ncbi:hypothetical protein ASPZODRAFT_151470 [Penicilliopsis zonata CBS 506.65]|uniref:Uncharacterized protein n=1 Tax=Penicilliopsis zonata CBS 506.65 TaxID=1073090 RepID=A0A1L9SIA3_9EURO|nr:hypothetical protein ASPZODRAFT_151470 [Penicilliopsis zonata CBS 506.65]OJJ46846.1 hypothetical protein ASPZODRAFT_151470 [Penicilliopsis zonata CBS 506.65]
MASCTEAGRVSISADSPSREERFSDDKSGGGSDEEEYDEEWFPGDGICPSPSQFTACCNSSFDTWKKATATSPDILQSPPAFYIQAFLKLLANVPSFFHHPPENINIAGGPRSPLVLRSSFRLEIADESDCVDCWKTFDYFQCLGFVSPVTYKVAKEAQCNGLPSLNLHAGYLCSIILAWSYIISARWVEILQRAGWNSLMIHSQDAETIDSFWNMVLQRHWLARLKTDRGIFYSPWMMSDGAVRPAGSSDNLAQNPLNSTLAFDILLNFCISESLEFEFIIGLASVLMFTSRNAPPPKLAPPTSSVLDKCIFLSSTQDALDSLLCSAFFNPSVPCNLLGANSLGIKRALYPSGIEFHKLLSAVTSQTPHLSLLWVSVICTGQAGSIIRLALDRLPPLCLAAAFWTKTIQSFLQVVYQEIPDGSSVSRAREFQTSYLCRAETSIPWTPSPPFGSTSIDNLSLEVREHIGHNHRPRSWRIDWILESGERIPASPQHQINLPSCAIHPDGSDEGCEEPQILDREAADEQSRSATSRLFNWHRTYDDGIWLEDGTQNIEKTRRIHLHPWIVDPFHDSGWEEPVETSSEVDPEAILK